jgi:hypothetical protein
MLEVCGLQGVFNLENTVLACKTAPTGLLALLAHKIAPVLILNMHLTGRIATGLFALQHGVLEIRVFASGTVFTISGPRCFDSAHLGPDERTVS